MPDKLSLVVGLLCSGLMLLVGVEVRAEEFVPLDPSSIVGQEAVSGQPIAQQWMVPGAAEERPVKEEFGLADRISALAAGRVQLDVGYIFTYEKSRGTTSYEHALPDLLLRVGLTERLEVRVGWPGYRSVHYDEPDEGLSFDETLDPNVGLMYDLIPQEGWIPQTAVLASVPISLDGNPLAFESLQPVVQMLYLWYLNERWSLGGTTGAVLLREDGDYHLRLQQSVGVDYVLSDRLGSYLEWNALFGSGSGSDGTQHLLSGGLSFLWTDRFQTTWEVGVGLSEAAPDLLTAIRFSYRF